MTQRDHEQRWNEMALGHVLGGLEDADASTFRGHLATCQQCRARVAELRSMASDLAAAEREERATRALQTEVASRGDPVSSVDDDQDPPLRLRVLVAGGVIVVILLVLVLWNAQLRTENVALRQVADHHAQTLVTLGAGTAVPAQTSGSVTGVVSVDDDRVAWSLAGLPVPATGTRLVLWIEADGEIVQEHVYRPEQVLRDSGRLAGTINVADASRLLVTLESVTVAQRPIGSVVVEADLDGGAPER